MILCYIAHYERMLIRFRTILCVVFIKILKKNKHGIILLCPPIINYNNKFDLTGNDSNSDNSRTRRAHIFGMYSTTVKRGNFLTLNLASVKIVTKLTPFLAVKMLGFDFIFFNVRGTP